MKDSCFLRWAALFSLSLAILLQGCGSDQSPAVNPPPKVAPKATPAERQVAPVNTERQLVARKSWEVENYAYDPGGRPDPFKSFLVGRVSKEQELIPPLQQREVTEMKVIGIVWGEMGRSAMLQAPDGKGYTIKEGTRVGPNQGVVKRITPREVVVVERRTNVFGEKETREVILELGPSTESIE